DRAPRGARAPLDDGTAVLLERSIDATAANLGPDARAYRRLVAPLVPEWDHLAADALGPLIRIPRHPFVMARLGLPGVLPARALRASRGALRVAPRRSAHGVLRPHVRGGDARRELATTAWRIAAHCRRARRAPAIARRHDRDGSPRRKPGRDRCGRGVSLRRDPAAARR